MVGWRVLLELIVNPWRRPFRFRGRRSLMELVANPWSRGVILCEWLSVVTSDFVPDVAKTHD
jgi:hypothetical protein